MTRSTPEAVRSWFMFTGIVQHRGRVVSADQDRFSTALTVDAREWSHRPQRGDSVAVNGCCLTVAEQPSDGLLQFDIIQQTLGSTTLGSLRTDDEVNLEHAVTPATLLGGHVVQGHVDGVGEVVDLIRDQTQWRLRIQPPAALMMHIVEKGSVALEGVSLTVARVGQLWFEVALIPTTLEITNLSKLKPSSRINIETDYLAKIVVNWMERQHVQK
jgi:riboflavin synthase